LKSGGEYFIESVTSISDKRGTGLYSASQAKNDSLCEINYLVDEIVVLVGIFIRKRCNILTMETMLVYLETILKIV
jgi:hypothetical protein